jgi:hypothetical protein
MTQEEVSYIYVICEGKDASSVKIGFSANPERRVKQLQTGHEGTLSLIHKEEIPAANVRAMEEIVHKLLRHRKVRGEWFNLTADDAVAEIKHAVIRYGDIENLGTMLRSGNLRL